MKLKEQTMIVELTTMRGIFVKKPDKKFLAFVITLKDSIIIFQVVGLAEGKIIAAFAGGIETVDQEYAEEIYDTIKYAGNKEIIETLPSSTKIGASNVVVTLKKQSKYVGPKITFQIDNRLGEGYYFLHIKIKKKELQPMTQLKVGDMGKMKAMKKMIGMKFTALTRNKINTAFKLK